MRPAGVMLVLLLVLAACAGGPHAANGDAPPITKESPLSANEVDYSCSVDADCTVKNVGNCCGYYPACVNRDSPTFPELVQQRCEAEGMSSICGFPTIERCTCIAGRCEAVTGAHDGGLEVR
jgi:hypothetical protein